jgi:hypothetical protein
MRPWQRQRLQRNPSQASTEDPEEKQGNLLDYVRGLGPDEELARTLEEIIKEGDMKKNLGSRTASFSFCQGRSG